MQVSARDTVGCSSLVAIRIPPPRSTTRPPTPPAPALPCLNGQCSTQQVSPAPSPALAAIYNADVTDAGVILCGGSEGPHLHLPHQLPPPGCRELGVGAVRHTSWVTSTGKLMLLGGLDGDFRLATTEVVGDGPSFTLQRAAR